MSKREIWEKIIKDLRLLDATGQDIVKIMHHFESMGIKVSIEKKEEEN